MTSRTDTRDHGIRADLDDVGLKTLLGRLNQDATQLIHDELDLARLELRHLAGTVSSEVHDATRTLVKDLMKVGIALTLASLAGLALTAGAIMAIGALLSAYWAGGLIVGIVLMIAAAVFGKSAASDMKESDALRLERTRDAIAHEKQVVSEQARETKQFVQREARGFKDAATN
ncbi:hypothetical protein BH23GEM10_BH23GEM10_13680 [soil metagenome]